MVRVLVCDICKQPTDEIASKMFFTPITRGNGGRNSAYSRYELHLDVGVCCVERVKKGFNWHKRISAKQYAQSRRKASR